MPGELHGGPGVRTSRIMSISLLAVAGLSLLAGAIAVAVVPQEWLGAGSRARGDVPAFAAMCDAAIASSAIFGLIRWHYPKQQHRGLVITGAVDIAVTFMVGLLLSYTQNWLWIPIVFGFLLISYIDYVTRWHSLLPGDQE